MAALKSALKSSSYVFDHRTGPEHLIILKLLGGSSLDIADARGILGTQAGRIGTALLRQICPAQLGGALDRLLFDSPPASGRPYWR